MVCIQIDDDRQVDADMHNGVLFSHEKGHLVICNDTLLFATTWMDLEAMKLSETSSIEK